MLTPEQIQAIARQRGDTIVATTPTEAAGANDVQSRLKEFDDLIAAEPTPPTPAPKPAGTLQKIAGAGMGLINSAADNTMSQFSGAGKKIIGSIKEGANKMQKGGGISAELETGLGTASGAVQGVFAPITGIIQSIAEKVSDSKHVQDFAAGNKTVGGILDLHEQVQRKLEEIAKAHPEAAKNLGDAANVLLGVLGGKSGAATTEMGEGASSALKAAEDAVQGTKETIRGAQEGSADLTKTIGEKTAAAKQSIGKQLPMTAKGIFSKVYRLSPETTDFFLQHPEYANHETLSTSNVFNLGKRVEGEIKNARDQMPSAGALAEEVKNAATKKVMKISADTPTPENLGAEVKDAYLKRKQMIKENAMKYPTGSLSAPNAEKGVVRVDRNWLADQLQNKEVAGVRIAEDGRISHGDSNSKINPVDTPNGAQILQNLWDTYGPDFASGKMTRAKFIKFRQSLATLADYRGGVDTVVEKVADKLRDNFNKEYRKQIPGLEKLDATHTKMTRDNERLGKGLIVEDPATGQVSLQEGAISRIVNSTKETKGETLKQLEELVPGITKKIKQMEDAQAEVGRITHGLIDEKGNLMETAEGKIAGAAGTGKNMLSQRLEELVPGIGMKISDMKKFNDEWRSIVDEGGNLRENALLNIKNSLNSGRDVRLEKLEKLMPGITDELKLIHASDEFHNAMKGLPGSYVGAAGISQIFTGNPLLGLLTAVATQPNVGLKILKILGERAKR